MHRLRRRPLYVVGVSVLVVAVLAGTAVFVLTRTSGESHLDPLRPGVDLTDPAVGAADRFAAALSSGDFTGVRVSDPARSADDVAEEVQFTFAGLVAGGGTGPAVEVTSVERGSGTEASDRATANVRTTWTFLGDRTWTYDTSWLLVEAPEVEDDDGAWRVAFDPAMLLPPHGANQVVQVSRVPAVRGQILDTTGRSLTPGGGTVTIGIRPSRATDLEGAARQVAGLAGVDPDELVARVLAAGPQDFVEVATLDRADYDRIRAQVRPIPGTVFTEQEAVSDLPASYARGVLGVVGPASAELAAASEGRVVEGEPTGISGIQAAYDEHLAGAPGMRIETVAIDGSGGRTLLHEFPPEAGRDVTVTLDRAVQAAADDALAGSSRPVALVAVRVSTGEVVAVANGPASAAGYNRAFVNRYPPGSTFKVASTLAYLQQGLTPDEIVGCPSTIVAGKRFKNAGEFALGDVPFRRAFARSCNTTIVNWSSTITPAQLTETAALLGFRDLDAEVGLDLFGVPVPEAVDATEHAANTIGQGKVEATPLAVALMSASVANGTSLSPRLVVDPLPAAHADAAPRPALPAGPVAALRDLMREVVTDGTGTALAGVPGGPVHAKTGTAEYGTEDPPRSHAWITGFQGDIAFAVVVEDGGSGGTVAGPVAADFLRRLAAG